MFLVVALYTSLCTVCSCIILWFPNLRNVLLNTIMATDLSEMSLLLHALTQVTSAISCTDWSATYYHQ